MTVSALIASGQSVQITYHLNRVMDNGLTREQAGEVVTSVGISKSTRFAEEHKCAFWSQLHVH